MLPESAGEILINIARKAIECRFTGKEVAIPDEDFLDAERGVFVTLSKKGELRGCIGFPEPVFPLGPAVRKAAVGAAFTDTRFPPVTEEELKEIKIEVSVLTLPEHIHAIDPQDYEDVIKIGRDGLIIEMHNQSGLLLPQVPVEWNWDVREFLEQVCHKAGLPPDAWLSEEAKLYKFEAQIFTE